MEIRKSLVRFVSGFVDHGRGAEVITTLALLGFALVLALPGNSVGQGAWHGLAQIGFDEASIGVPVALVAMMRGAALVINGAWHRSPLLRMIGAIVSAPIMALFAISAGMPYFEYVFLGGPAVHPSTGASTYTVLCVADLIAAYRCGADYRLAKSLRLRVA